MHFRKEFLIPAFAFICFFCIWEYTASAFDLVSLIIPTPSSIAKSFFERQDRFFFHTGHTVKTMLTGFLIAFSAAFPLAWLMFLWKSLRRVLEPFFIIIQCIPMFTLAPLMVLWFGWSFTAVVIPTALMIFFPLTMNIYQGLTSCPPALLDYFKIHQATTWQIFYKLQLPSALPHIVGGMRIAAAIAGIGAVAGEWAGAQNGLGMLMLESRRAVDLPASFAALFCLTFVSLSIYWLITGIEKAVAARKFSLSFLKKALIPFLFLAGFYFSAEVSFTPISQKETRLLLDWLPNPNHVPLYAGLRAGIFEKFGISLKIFKIHDPSETLPFLQSEQVDLAIYYMPATIRAINKGALIEPVGILIKEPLNSIIFLKDTLTSHADLNEKVIGYSIDGTETKFLNRLLAVNQINLKNKINAGFDLASALATKKVDAIYGAYWNIESEQLRSFGIETDFFRLTDLGMPNYYELIVLGKKGSPQTTEEFKKRFQQALEASIAFCINSPEEAFHLYLEANPDKGKETALWEKKAWEKTVPLLARSQTIDSDEWEKFSKWQKESQNFSGNL